MNIRSTKLRLVVLVAGLCLSLSSFAQDIHFSQYYASPLTLNPSLVGKFNGEYRIGGIYRSQWAPASQPLFMTPELFVDFSLFKGKLKKDALGVGISVYTDRQNKGGFVWYYPSLSLAYHKGIGKNNGTQISLGFQAAYCMKQLNFSRMQFADGFVLNPGGGGYDYTSSADYNNINTKVNYFDMNMGLFVNSRVAKMATLYGGFSWFHLGTPNEKFMKAGTSPDIAWRFLANAGAELNVHEKVVLIPGILYQYQNKAQEMNFGVTGGYHIKKDESGNTTIFVGLWNRMTPNTNGVKAKWGEESIIPKLGFEIKRIRFGAALDVPLSQIKNTKDGIVAGTGLAASYKGNRPMAFEISLSYVGRIFTPKEDVYLFNPRF